jgi:EmrB/QacA subfamily drug resistance transporter
MENKNNNKTLTILFIGVLMGALDIAIISPALPSIRSYFGISERALAWVFSIYVLFNLMGTPLMAKLSDRFGRRAIYVLDVALFAAGSLMVALAPSSSFAMVLAGRAIQGFGAGGIFPVASAVIGDTFPPEKRGRALGLIGAVFGIAFIIGPILGGVILSFASWQWLFIINLPIAATVIVLSLRGLPSKKIDAGKKFDWAGVGVLAAMLASLALALNQLNTSAFLASLISVNVLPFLIGFIVLLVVLVMVEKRAENPLLSPQLFNRKQLLLTYALSSGGGFVEAGLVYIPLLGVISLASRGITNSNSSWLLMPVVLAMSVGSPLAGRFLDKIGSRMVILFGTFVTAVGMALLGLFPGSLALFILSGALIGFGLSSLLGAPLRYVMLNETTVEERSIAQGVVAVFSSTGQLLGASLTGAIAASYALKTNGAAGYSKAFLVTGIISVVMLAIAFMLKNRGAELATVHENEKANAAIK